MKPDDLIDAIGDVSDEAVKRAVEEKKSHKSGWIAVGTLAACMVIIFFLPIIMIPLRGANSAAPDNNTDNAVLWSYVSVYYVDGNTVKSEEQWLPLTADGVFYAWRDKNGLDSDVTFIEAKIKSNGQESIIDFEGEGAANYDVGDEFEYILTISKNLENYFDTIDRELLIESLEKTMTEYSGSDYQNFRLILK